MKEENRNHSNARLGFTIYLVLLAMGIAIFFWIGWKGIRYITILDLLNAYSTALQVITPHPIIYAIRTMTPIYIVSSIELTVWVICSVSGIFSKPKAMAKVVFGFFIITAMMVWFYSIF